MKNHYNEVDQLSTNFTVNCQLQRGAVIKILDPRTIDAPSFLDPEYTYVPNPISTVHLKRFISESIKE